MAKIKILEVYMYFKKNHKSATLQSDQKSSNIKSNDLRHSNSIDLVGWLFWA